MRRSTTELETGSLCDDWSGMVQGIESLWQEQKFWLFQLIYTLNKGDPYIDVPHPIIGVPQQSQGAFGKSYS